MHAIICERGIFVIQCHNELRDLEAEHLNVVCKDVEIEPIAHAGSVSTENTYIQE